MEYKYECPRCGYNTNRSDCITNHYNRKTACKARSSNISLNELRLKLIASHKNAHMHTRTHKCRYCNSTYKQKSHCTRHEKTCKSARLDHLPPYPCAIDDIKTILFSNIDKSSIVRIENGALKYSDFMIDCLMRKENGVLDIIKRVYFDDNYVMAMRDDTLVLYNGKNWIRDTWANVVDPFMTIWCKILYKCYEQHSDDIQKRFMKDDSEISFRDAMNKRLEVEDFLAYIESNEGMRADIRQCIINHSLDIKKV